MNIAALSSDPSIVLAPPLPRPGPHPAPPAGASSGPSAVPSLPRVAPSALAAALTLPESGPRAPGVDTPRPGRDVFCEQPPAPRGPTPDWLRIGFAPEALDPATIRATLMQGRPFAPDVDAKLQAILGRPLHAGGVEALFARAWPSAAWVVSYEEVDDEFEMPRFTLSALDRSGKVIFDVMIGFWRAPDGAIDMHAAGADVDVEHRGFGITAYAELMRENILRAFSSASGARLSLQASNAVNANTGARQAPSGFYLHALRGYMLSDSQNVPALPYPRDTPDGDADRDLSQLALLAKYFKRWAEARVSTLGAIDCTALTAACTQPVDYARMTVAGRAVGRDYLVSGEAPGWCGVHFVNPPDAMAATDARARDRQRSGRIWQEQLQREIGAANRRTQAVRQSLWEQVGAADAGIRAAGYRGIGMQAHPAAVTFLAARLKIEHDAEARAGLRDAIAHLRSERIDAGLQAAADDVTRPDVVREEMRQRLAARQAGAQFAEKADAC